MGYYSDPTANMALGNINREFARLEKKAKQLCRMYLNGQLSDAEFQRACRGFRGLYANLPDNALRKALEEK